MRLGLVYKGVLGLNCSFRERKNYKKVQGISFYYDNKHNLVTDMYMYMPMHHVYTIGAFK